MTRPPGDFKADRTGRLRLPTDFRRYLPTAPAATQAPPAEPSYEEKLRAFLEGHTTRVISLRQLMTEWNQER